MLVFQLLFQRHPNAVAPDFSKHFKREETIRRYTDEWANLGWTDDPTAVQVIGAHYIYNGEYIIAMLGKDEFDDFVSRLCAEYHNGDIVCQSFTKQTSSLLACLIELDHTYASVLYGVKTSHMRSNFCSEHVHDPLKVLQMDPNEDYQEMQRTMARFGFSQDFSDPFEHQLRFMEWLAEVVLIPRV